MIGKPNQLETKLFYHGLSLERRMPQEHPLRKIKKLIDFNFIRSKVADLYGKNGNESVDPAVILKLIFLLFYENIKSERALTQQLPLRMDWLWFCDYDLDQKTPDHSVISKARHRWGMEAFTAFFNNILTQCIDAGLVDGETIHIDSSMIDANASKDTLKCQFQAVSNDLYNQLENNCQPSPQKLEKRISETDPDARLGKKYGKTTLGYKDHRAVDDKHGIITATVTTPANVNDEKVMQDVIIEHQKNTSIKVETVAADKAYGTAENYAYLHQQHITPCISHKQQNSHCDPAFNKDKFVYDKQNDIYICPVGNELKFSHFKSEKDAFVYRANRKVCQQCIHFEKCVAGKNCGRQIQRMTNEKYIEWSDSCLSIHKRKYLMARRKAKAEGSFADASNNHGFKRSRLRGLAKMKIQNLLIAAIQNVRKLIACISRKPSIFAKNAVFVRCFSCKSNFLTIISANLSEY